MPCIYYLICWLGNWLPCSPVVSQTPWQYPAGPLRLHIGMLMGIEWDGSTSCCLSQVPRKPRCSCERCSGETGVLWLFALLLSILEALYFGSSSIFPLSTRCLREQAEESSGFFKMWKQHGKLLLCMSLHGIVNLIHSSLYMEKQGVHSSLMRGFFSSGTMDITFFFLLSCLLLLGNHLHLEFASVFHMGKEACSSCCGPYIWQVCQLWVTGSQVNGVGWASPPQSSPQGGKKGSQCQTNVYRKFSLQWISLFQWNNRRGLCCIIHASLLFWYYLWILANNRWLRPLLFWEVGRWKH